MSQGQTDYAASRASLPGGAPLEHFAKLAQLGIDQAICNMPNAHESEPYEVRRAIIPAVEALRVAGR